MVIQKVNHLDKADARQLLTLLQVTGFTFLVQSMS